MDALFVDGVPKTDAAHIVIDPSGLSDVLQKLRGRYGDLRIVISENGAAFRDDKDEEGNIHDPKRIEYLRSHLRSIQNAIATGCNVQGYFVWTLIDTWEWTDGYDPRYGLVYLDLETQKRTPKSSYA